MNLAICNGRLKNKQKRKTKLNNGTATLFEPYLLPLQSITVVLSHPKLIASGAMLYVMREALEKLIGETK